MMKATPVSSLVVAQAELLFCCRVMTIKDVAQETHLDWKTIKELAKQYMGGKLRRIGIQLPRSLGATRLPFARATASRRSRRFARNR